MTTKFDPTPFDKHTEDQIDAIKADQKTSEKLKRGLIGGSFPASDPLSADQPSPSEFDSKSDS